METLHVHNEIGRLRRVMLHRPGGELLNLVPRSLGRLLFDDIPFLDVAREEHDRFAALLAAEGVEVVYLERLVAEALDAMPDGREEFTEAWLDESGIVGERLRDAVREYLATIGTTQALVEKCIAGVRRSEITLPLASATLLTDLVGADQDSETDLLVEPMPNAYFTRDPFAVVGDGVMLNHRFSVTRRRETLLASFVFRHHPTYAGVPLWYRRDNAFEVEGGDVLVLGPRSIAVGISQRTQAAAIDLLAQNLFWDVPGSEVDTIYAFNIPVSRAFMHLDTVFTQVDVDTFTIHPAILGTCQVFRMTKGAERGDVRITEMNDRLEHVLAGALGLDAVRLIPCGGGDPVAAAREQWNDGSNTLAVAPGRICVYQRNTATNEVLYKAGLELVVIPSAELSRGRGGPRCMSMPFWRDDV